METPNDGSSGGGGGGGGPRLESQLNVYSHRNPQITVSHTSKRWLVNRDAQRAANMSSLCVCVRPCVRVCVRGDVL